MRYSNTELTTAALPESGVIHVESVRSAAATDPDRAARVFLAIMTSAAPIRHAAIYVFAGELEKGDIHPAAKSRTTYQGATITFTAVATAFSKKVGLDQFKIGEDKLTREDVEMLALMFYGYLIEGGFAGKDTKRTRVRRVYRNNTTPTWDNVVRHHLRSQMLKLPAVKISHPDKASVSTRVDEIVDGFRVAVAELQVLQQVRVRLNRLPAVTAAYLRQADAHEHGLAMLTEGGTFASVHELMRFLPFLQEVIAVKDPDREAADVTISKNRRNLEFGLQAASTIERVPLLGTRSRLAATSLLGEDGQLSFKTLEIVHPRYAPIGHATHYIPTTMYENENTALIKYKTVSRLAASLEEELRNTAPLTLPVGRMGANPGALNMTIFDLGYGPGVIVVDAVSAILVLDSDVSATNEQRNVLSRAMNTVKDDSKRTATTTVKGLKHTVTTTWGELKTTTENPFGGDASVDCFAEVPEAILFELACLCSDAVMFDETNNRVTYQFKAARAGEGLAAKDVMVQDETIIHTRNKLAVIRASRKDYESGWTGSTSTAVDPMEAYVDDTERYVIAPETQPVLLETTGATVQADKTGVLSVDQQQMRTMEAMRFEKQVLFSVGVLAVLNSLDTAMHRWLLTIVVATDAIAKDRQSAVIRRMISPAISQWAEAVALDQGVRLFHAMATQDGKVTRTLSINTLDGAARAGSMLVNGALLALRASHQCGQSVPVDVMRLLVRSDRELLEHLTYQAHRVVAMQ